MLIALGGNPRSGKSLASLFFADYGFVIKEFIDPVRDLVEKEYGIPVADLIGESKDRVIERLGKTPREILRGEAERLRRESDNGIIPGLDFSSPGNIIIPGIRSHSEAEFVLDNGGYLIRVCRQGTYQERVENPIRWTQIHHIVIQNNSSVADFERNCRSILSWIPMGPGHNIL